MNAGRILVAEYAIAVTVAVYQEIRGGKVWPRPQRLVGAGLSFGILGLASPFISVPLAATFGAGLVLALAYNLFPADDAAGSENEKGKDRAVS